MKVRKDPRVAVGWAVEVTALGWMERLDLTTVDLSFGGAFLRTDQDVEVGSSLQLTFQADGLESIPVFATVVRVISMGNLEVGAEPGVGVSFLDPPDALLNLVESHLDEDADDEPSEADIATASPTFMLGEKWWEDGLNQLKDQIRDQHDLGPAEQTWGPEDLAEALAEAKAIGPASPDPPASEPIREAATPAMSDMAALRLMRRSRLAMGEGNHLEAQELAEQLVAAFPDAPKYKVLFHLAVAGLFKAHGDIDSATLHWEDALALEPDCHDAIRELRALQETPEEKVERKKGLFDKLLGRK